MYFNFLLCYMKLVKMQCVRYPSSSHNQQSIFCRGLIVYFIFLWVFQGWLSQLIPVKHDQVKLFFICTSCLFRLLFHLPVQVVSLILEVVDLSAQLWDQFDVFAELEDLFLEVSVYLSPLLHLSLQPNLILLQSPYFLFQSVLLSFMVLPQDFNIVFCNSEEIYVSYANQSQKTWVINLHVLLFESSLIFSLFQEIPLYFIKIL